MTGLAQVCLAVFLLGLVGWALSFVDFKAIKYWLDHPNE